MSDKNTNAQSPAPVENKTELFINGSMASIVNTRVFHAEDLLNQLITDASNVRCNIEGMMAQRKTLDGYIDQLKEAVKSK